MMDKNRQAVLQCQIERTMRALRANRMAAYYAPTCADAVRQVEALLSEGDVVTHGGSMTLEECGVVDLLKSGKYTYLDRNDPSLSPQQVQEIYQRAFTADAYLTSANAITENGELYNVDGNCNRVAAILYGPKRVIVVAGYNKIVPDLAHAVERVKQIAAPANGVRLGCDTPCAKTGICTAKEMTDGCRSPQRMCANYVISAQQRIPDRIQVILVGESLGY